MICTLSLCLWYALSIDRILLIVFNVAYESGQSSLLLHLTGTLPVTFRGTIYRFPIALWIPHAYPKEAPICYVIPTPGMVIRPGQYVSGEGRVYHPYLAEWASSRGGLNVSAISYEAGLATCTV